MTDEIRSNEELQADGFEELLEWFEQQQGLTNRSIAERDIDYELLKGHSSVVTFAQQIATRFGRK